MAEPLIHLIDADAAFAARVIETFAKQGLRVVAFGDGNDALMSREVPQLIILCIDPKRLGWALCTRVKKTPALRGVPLIVTSAEASERDFEDHKTLKSRAEDYIRKPVAPEALLARAGVLLGGLAVAAPPASSPEDSLPFEDIEVVVEIDDPPPAPRTAADEFSERTSIAPVDALLGDEPVVEAADAPNIDALPSIPLDIAPAASGRSVAPARPQPAAISSVPPPGARPPAVDTRPAPLPALDIGLADRQARSGESSSVARLPTVERALEETRGERDRLQRELEEAQRELRARAGKGEAATPFARERDLLNLREVINRKERENLDLRDSLDGKDRQLLDARDKLREVERARRDGDDKALAMEKDLVSAQEQVAALEHERDEGAARDRANKARLDELQKKLDRSLAEAEERRAKLATELEALRATIAQAQAARETADKQLSAERAANEKQRATAAAQRDAALAAERSGHERVLAEQGKAHAAALAEAEKLHRAAAAAATKELERARAEQAAAIEALDRRSGEERAALVAAQQQALADLEAQRADRLREERTLWEAKLGESIAEMQSQVTVARAAAAAAQAELKSRIVALEAELEAARAVATTQLGDLSARDARLAAREQEFTELEAERVRLEEQVLRAYQRIKDDELAATRARKALAIAVALLEAPTPPAATPARKGI